MRFFQLNQEDIAKEVFDNEAVIINIQLGKYYSVRGGTGVRVLEILEDAVTTEHLVSMVINDYDVNEVDAKTSVESFLSQLENEQIIYQVEEKKNGAISIEERVNKLPFEKLEIEVFDDMQELILLDPVLDVESFKGWPQKKDETT